MRPVWALVANRRRRESLSPLAAAEQVISCLNMVSEWVTAEYGSPLRWVNAGYTDDWLDPVKVQGVIDEVRRTNTLASDSYAGFSTAGYLDLSTVDVSSDRSFAGVRFSVDLEAAVGIGPDPGVGFGCEFNTFSDPPALSLLETPVGSMIGLMCSAAQTLGPDARVRVDDDRFYDAYFDSDYADSDPRLSVGVYTLVPEGLVVEPWPETLSRRPAPGLPGWQVVITDLEQYGRDPAVLLPDLITLNRALLASENGSASR